MAADDKAIRTPRMKQTTRTSWLRKFKITRRMKKTRKGDEDERYGEDEDHGRTMRTTRMMAMGKMKVNMKAKHEDGNDNYILCLMSLATFPKRLNGVGASHS